MKESGSAAEPQPWIVALVGTCVFLNLYAPQPILPMLARLFEVSAARASAIVSAATLGVAIVAPFAGALADRIGRKPMIVFSLVGLAVSTAMTSTATNLPQAVAWRFLTGVFTPGVISSVLAYIAEEWGPAQAPRVTALYVSGTVLGGFAGRVLSGFLGERGDWRVSFVILGLATAIGALAAARAMPTSRHFLRQTDWSQSLSAFIRHLRNPRLIATYAVGFCVLFSLVATFTYITFHLAAPPYRVGPAGQAMLFFVYLLGLFITPGSGRIIQRIGYRKALLLALMLSALGVGATLLGPIWLIVAGLALCSSGVFICQAAASGYAGVAADFARSAAAGLYVTFYYLGGSVGAALPGIIWERAGWTGCALLVLGVQFVAGSIAFLFWRQP
jgi:YNFM family putative membrane transporter